MNKSVTGLLYNAAIGLGALLLSGATQLAYSAESINERLEVSASERIHLDIMRGEVRVRTHDANEIVIEGTLDERATGHELTQRRGVTRFKVEMPRNFTSERGEQESDLTVLVPSGVELEINGVNLRVDVEDVRGGTVIETVNGNIEAANLGGRVALQTVNGNIESSDNGDNVSLKTVNGTLRDQGATGRVRYESVNGSIRASGQATDVEAQTVNGSLELDMPQAESISVNAVNGALTVTTLVEAPRVRVRTVGGSVTVVLNSAVDARIAAKSATSGRLQDDLAGNEAQRPRFGPGGSLEFSHGNGRGQVEINTVSGSVTIKGQ